MNCGNCLMDRVKMIRLVGGVCPECGADYRHEYDIQTDRGRMKVAAGSQAEAEELARTDGHTVTPIG